MIKNDLKYIEGEKLYCRCDRVSFYDDYFNLDIYIKMIKPEDGIKKYKCKKCKLIFWIKRDLNLKPLEFINLKSKSRNKSNTRKIYW